MTLFVVLLTGLVSPAQVKNRSGAGATVQSFFNLLKTGQYAALYEYLPSDIQQQLTREQLTQSLRRLSDFILVERLEIGRRQERGDLAVVDTMIYGRLKRPVNLQGTEIREGRISVQQYLFRENGVWKIATANDRTRATFLRRHPGFARDFTLTSPQISYRRGEQWERWSGDQPR
jgi:hypothetical protein